MRILRNLSDQTITTNFRGRVISIRGKTTMVIPDNCEEANAMANYLLETYGFLREEFIRPKPTAIDNVKKALGKKVKR